MNEDFEDIQRLIRLKKHESPGEGYTDDFLTRFQRRQREEMLRKSSIDLFFERISTRFEAFMTPKWALAGATAAACVLGVWFYSNPLNSGASNVANQTELTSPAEKSPPEEVQDDPNRAKRDSKALPAGGRQEVTPTGAAPAIHDGSKGSLGL